MCKIILHFYFCYLWVVTLEQAIQHLVNSREFKDIAKQKNPLGGKYRMFITRFNKRELKNGAAVDFLLEHGYKIEVRKPK